MLGSLRKRPAKLLDREGRRYIVPPLVIISRVLLYAQQALDNQKICQVVGSGRKEAHSSNESDLLMHFSHVLGDKTIHSKSMNGTYLNFWMPAFVGVFQTLLDFRFLLVGQGDCLCNCTFCNQERKCWKFL